MKTLLQNFPEGTNPWIDPVQNFSMLYKQAEDHLQQIVSLLSQQEEIEKIICFGNRASGEILMSCFATPSAQLTVHYFLLVITNGNERREHLLQDYVNAHFKGGKITLLSHRKETVENALKAGKPFFHLVYRHGKLLYATDGLLNHSSIGFTVPLSDTEQLRREYLIGYTLSKGFLRSAEDAWEKEDLRIAMFLLHQAMEQACNMLIGVYMHYRSELHNLGRLLDISLCFFASSDLYPRQRTGDELMFKILQSSYSEARYKQNFEVSYSEAKRILDEVAVFIDMVEMACLRKLNKAV